MPLQNYELSLIIVSDKEFNNWLELLAHVHETLGMLKLSYEILVAAKPDKNTRQLAERNLCTLVPGSTGNYGTLLRMAIHQASGGYILTIDADQTQPGDLIRCLWEAWMPQRSRLVLGVRYKTRLRTRVRKLYSPGRVNPGIT
jgi:hypothetical protein